jgi:hypothetical protein
MAANVSQMIRQIQKMSQKPFPWCHSDIEMESKKKNTMNRIAEAIISMPLANDFRTSLEYLYVALYIQVSSPSVTVCMTIRYILVKLMSDSHFSVRNNPLVDLDLAEKLADFMVSQKEENYAPFNKDYVDAFTVDKLGSFVNEYICSTETKPYAIDLEKMVSVHNPFTCYIRCYQKPCEPCAAILSQLNLLKQKSLQTHSLKVDGTTVYIIILRLICAYRGIVKRLPVPEIYPNIPGVVRSVRMIRSPPPTPLIKKYESRVTKR